jgi:hypothetical protein
VSDTPTCETCRFMHGPFEDREAVCRRLPPVTQQIGFMGQWPFVRPSDWCGEYQPHAPQGQPSDEQAALAIVKSTAGELTAAADALYTAAKYLKDDGKAFRASEARQAAERAKTAARGLIGG